MYRNRPLASLVACSADNPFYDPDAGIHGGAFRIDLGGPGLDLSGSIRRDLAGSPPPDLAVTQPPDLAVTRPPDLAAPVARVVLVGPQTTWRYLDDGSNQGSAWRPPAYDDRAWRSGPAELGYGDDDEATVVRFGPDPDRKFITTYFRAAFDAQCVDAVRRLELRLVRDDGVFVYLNGLEVLRDNMPGGAIDFRTEASQTVGGNDERAWRTFAVDPKLLEDGRNVIAAEVHQSNEGSSDLSFALELVSHTN